MRVAVPVWNDRVSPVFDVARSLQVVDIAHGEVLNMSVRELYHGKRVAAMVKLGVDVLICAAISTPLEATLWMSGIEVVSDTCGGVAEIINAFSAGDRTLTKFRSPGKTAHHRATAARPSRHRAADRPSR
jgi:predicted Fe-Mo cluster-binding NifX family protein